MAEPRQDEGLQVRGRKGRAYQQALAVLVLFALMAGLNTSPLAWDLSEGALPALLAALAGILATFVGGNAAEHVAQRPQGPTSDSEEG